MKKARSKRPTPSDTWAVRTARAVRSLQKVSRGMFVVMTPYAGQQGLNTSFPIGRLIAKDGATITVRKVGRRVASSFYVGFWQPAPPKLQNLLLRGKIDELDDV